MKQLFTHIFSLVFLIICINNVQAQQLEQELRQDQLESIADSLLETEIEVVILMVPAETNNTQQGLLRLSRTLQEEEESTGKAIFINSVNIEGARYPLSQDYTLLERRPLLNTVWTPITNRSKPFSWPLLGDWAVYLR